MFDKIKENDVIALKFSTGEEVLATFKKADDSTISIMKGLVLMQGPQGVALGTFFSTADPEKEIVYVFLSNRSYPDGETASQSKLVKENIRSEIQRIIYNSIIE